MNTDAPVYEVVAGGSQLFASSVMPPGGFSGYWFSTAPGLTSATLAETWADVGGFYVITASLPHDLLVFEEQITALAPVVSPNGQVKVLWLENDDETDFLSWPTNVIQALPVGADDGPWALVAAAAFALGSYSVAVADGSTLTLLNGDGVYGLSLPAASTVVSNGPYSFDAVGDPLLDLAGVTTGALSVPLQLLPQQNTAVLFPSNDSQRALSVAAGTSGSTWFTIETLGEASVAEGIGATCFGMAYYAAFATNDSSKAVFVTSSIDGITWTSPVLCSAGPCSGTPALVSFGGQLYAVFQGADSSAALYLTSSADGINWASPPQQIPGVASGSSAALTSFSNQIFVAFRADDSGGALCVMSSADGVTWTSPSQPYPAMPIAGAPALAVFQGSLYAAFCSADSSGALFVISSTDGTTWGQPVATGIAIGSSPSLAVFGGALNVLFRANDSSHALCIASSSDGVSWTLSDSNPPVSAGYGTSALVAASFGQLNPFDQLGVMLRYATTPDPTDQQAVSDDLARYLSMPVLRLGSTSMPVTLVYDPSQPLAADRTWMDLTPDGASPYTLLSSFMSTLGDAVTLSPGMVGEAKPGRLAFCESPLHASTNDGEAVYHLAPDGAFTIGVAPASGNAALWMFGLSGAEYAALDALSGDWLVFRAGSPAFIPDSTAPGDPALTSLATTAQMTVLPATADSPGLLYYAQSLDASLFSGGSGGFLDFSPLLSGSLPIQSQSSHLDSVMFPAGAYCWLEPDEVELARELEAAVFAPVRRSVIGAAAMSAENAMASGLTGTGSSLIATPQGLALGVTSGDVTSVTFANLPASGQVLNFTPVGDRFAKALQANQVFFVVSDVTEFLSQSGVPAAGLNCTLDGYTFLLDPSEWLTAASGDPTLMLFKFGNRSLQDWADDFSTWGWPEAAGATPDLQLQTQQQLQALLADAAVRASHHEAPYVTFYQEIATNPDWNGVLFFNTEVDLSALPSELSFLAAGVDPAAFFAHHVGFSVSPVSAANGDVTLGQTAAFGLIHYVDQSDLTASTTVPFAYKTQRLEIRFANAGVAEFSAVCQLMVNRLFGANLTQPDPTVGNNLILTGSYQNVGGQASYSFVLSDPVLFNAHGTALTGVEVLAVRVQTATQTDSSNVSVSFTLQGNLRFIELTQFDMYSYGPDAAGDDSFLRFNGLSIEMTFPLATPDTQSFTAFESATSLDGANSVPRPNALAARFPMRIAGVTSGAADGSGPSPQQMGFVSIACPVEQSVMAARWYGLLWEVDLGSLGALSGSIALTMTVLTAWSSGTVLDVPVYLGVKLASYAPGIGSLPLQGVLRLAFQAFEFTANIPDSAPDQVVYQLWMRRFALSVLGWSFPAGNADLVLFGNPDNPASSLGWYAAYNESATGGQSLAATSVNRQLTNSRRSVPVG